MGRLFDDPDGGLVRADLVVQWEVAAEAGRGSSNDTSVDCLDAVVDL